MYSKLQYISQGDTANEQMDNIKNALNAGCKWIQLRFKQKDELSNNSFAENVKKECDSFRAKLIINDFPDVAKRIDADGVHVGLGDLSVNEVREIIGLEKIIGGTANTFQHVLQRNEEFCDYVGLGPYTFTETKKELSPIVGLEGFQKIVSKARELGVYIPIYAIGGIQLEDIKGIMATGISGVAMSGAITNAVDRKEFINQVNNALNGKFKNS